MAHRSRFTEFSADGDSRPVALQRSLVTAGAVGQSPVFIDAGLSGIQVVLKRVKMWQQKRAAPASSGQFRGRDHPYVLRPIAELVGDEENLVHFARRGEGIIVYPYCGGGRLAEWAVAVGLHESRSGCGARWAEAARIVWCVQLAAEAMLWQGINAVSAVQPDEIFLDDVGTPRLREPVPGRRSCNMEVLKWQSPDEVAGLADRDDSWGALSYRLGMLLYCLCKGEGGFDPYPGKSADAVLADLLREAHGLSEPVRPDIALFRGPEVLRRLVQACFRSGGQRPPTRCFMALVLQTMSGPQRCTPRCVPGAQ